MGAPKAKRPQATVWLQPRTTPDPPASFKNATLAYPEARAAFQKLTGAGSRKGPVRAFGQQAVAQYVHRLIGAGLDEDLLWRHLWGLASLEKAGGSQPSPWYTLPGFPPHTLRRFPNRVRRMADEIERLSQRIQSKEPYRTIDEHFPLFCPSAHVKLQVEGESGAVIDETNPPIRGFPRFDLRQWEERHKFAELPKLLRSYADYIAALDRVVAHRAPRGRALVRAMPLELNEAVKTQTGKYFAEEIATLLTAAYAAVGSDTIVDPKALQMQRLRRSRKK